MTAIAIDSLAFVKTIEAAGFDRKQAEAIAKAVAGLRVEQNGTASREDLLAQEKEIVDVKHEIALIHKDIAEIKNAMATTMATKADLHELEMRMTIKLGGMIVAPGGILIAIKYFG